MAIEKSDRTDPPTSGDGPLSQRARWIRFGSNVAVAVLLAAVLTVAVVGLSSKLLRGKARSDWTATGRFSLSPRTKEMLARLPFEVRLTNLYTRAPEYPETVEQWERVQDLLEEYETATGRITVETAEAAGVEKLVQRLRERYAGEMEKPRQILETFEDLQSDLATLLDEEARKVAAAADAWGAQGHPDVVANLRSMAVGWQRQKQILESETSVLRRLVDAELPDYAAALDVAKNLATSTRDLFRAVPTFFEQLKEIAGDQTPPPEIQTIFEAGRAPYEEMLERLDAFLAEAEDVGEMKIEEIRRQLSAGNVILVEAPEEVRVIGYDEVWTYNPNPGDAPDAPARLFDGESAVSSTLLALVEPKRPAVLFVTHGQPASGPGGPYGRIAERLRKANLIVEDWLVMQQPEMPAPEDMTKPILVFVPPPPPNPQRPMPPPTPEAYAEALAAVREGRAGALVFAEPGGMMGPSLPYTELFDLFGLEARLDAVCVHSVVADALGNTRAVAQIDVNDYEPHAITNPLSSLPSVFAGPCPILPAEDAPGDVTITPLVLLPTGPDWWADTVGWMALRGEAKRDEADDLIPSDENPIPLAVAVERRLGGPHAAEPGETPEGEAPAPRTQKAVFFGDAEFGFDNIAYYSDFFGRPVFPGNAEMLSNAALWVAGTEHLITLSPEAMRARRIETLGAWEWPLRIFVMVGLPLLAALAGVAVYVIRRR